MPIEQIKKYYRCVVCNNKFETYEAAACCELKHPNICEIYQEMYNPLLKK